MARTLSRVPIQFALFALLLALFTGCHQKADQERPKAESSPSRAAAQGTLDIEESTPPDYRLNLPPNFGRWTGDWDEIRKHNVLRMLVVYSKTSFFYDRGRPGGLNGALAQELERYLNQRHKTRLKKIQVAVMPVTPDQLLPSLNAGIGDIIAASVFVTPEREKIVDFTQPILTDARLIVVTNKDGPPIASVQDLSGKRIVANKTRLPYQLLLDESQKLTQAGKPGIHIVESDPQLLDEDLLEMTDAGLIPATVCWNKKAEIWSAVLPNLELNSGAELKSDGNLAWAMRKNSPQLKAALDDFFKTHREGTLFGRIMAQRYLSVKAVKQSTSQQELLKFRSYVKYFKKYSDQYDFDYLMIAAQAYQESMLRQELVSPRGAVGIMQVMPRFAAARPINIPNVRNAEQNIRAGTKMLAHITDTYFNDPGITRMNKTLFTFAAHNAGPGRNRSPPTFGTKRGPRS
jgi:membrane-bound lytic murein transglycosylase MltF